MHNVHLSALDLNLTLVLHALLTERSVSRAGKRLGLSQSATSHALSRLREALGDPLVLRTQRGVVPTSRAEALAQPLAQALALLETALVGPREFDPSTATRRFRIAATDYAELLLLPLLVRALAKEAPGVDLWVHAFSEDALPALRRGELDAVLGVFGADGTGPGIHAAPLLEDRLVCLVRARHPLTRGRLSRARFAAAEHALIAPRGTRGGPVDDALAKRGRERRVSVVVPHFLIAPHLVATTDLVLTVAEKMARAFAELLPLRILELPFPVPPVRLSMLWHARDDADPAHRWLRAQLSAAAGAGAVRARAR